jgi:hypothetical protein
MGVLGFIIGTLAGQLCGGVVYSRVSATERPLRRLAASIAAGFATAASASAVYVAFGVHRWLNGPESSWGPSLFLGVCMGICQAVLFRDRPFSAGTSRRESSGSAGA